MSKKILIVGSGSYIAKVLIASLRKENYECIGFTRIELNMEDESSIENFANSHTTDRWDGIIFCQGLNPSKNTKETSTGHIRRMLDVNITGPILLLKYIHAQLNSAASILFFSSIAASNGSYDPAYASAKSALNGLIHSLANEFMTCRFNAIALGLVEGSPVYHQMTPAFRQKHMDRMKGGKLIQPEDITELVLEVFNNENINRSILPLTGGQPV